MSANHLDRLVASALEQMAARAGRTSVAEIRARARSSPEPRGFLLALGRKPTPFELERITRLLAVERDEFRTHPESAKLLLGGGGDPRAIREAERPRGG